MDLGVLFLSVRQAAIGKRKKFAYPNNARMIGVIDMVSAIRSGRMHRANGALAYHVLEVMCAFDKSSETG